MSEAVNHPKHYNDGKIEVIEYIEDRGWGIPFCLGNAVKYISRAGKKDPSKTIEDIEKSIWYLKRAVEYMKADQEQREPVRPNDMNEPGGNGVGEYSGGGGSGPPARFIKLDLTPTERCQLHGHTWSGWIDLGGTQARRCERCLLGQSQ